MQDAGGKITIKYIDMHCDTLLTRLDPIRGERLLSNTRSVDFTKLKEGNSLAQFFAIFMIPRGENDFPGKKSGPRISMTDDEYIEKLHHELLEAIEENRQIISFAKNYDDLTKNEKSGKISAFLTIEDGRSVDGKIEKLERYYQMGFRLITLTWNFENCFGFPNSRDSEQMKKGLKPFGVEAVKRMNELGILIDVSHLSDGGFFDVAKYSRKPFVASHSNARAISPHQRNLTDEMIKILANSGGTIGLNFGPEFLNRDISCSESRMEQICAHAKHIRNVGGIDCISIGSDFDGIRGNLEISDASKMPMLFEHFDTEGFTEDEIEKIAYKNVLRVIKESMK